MHDEHSVTRWISGLREGDDDAAREIWDRYNARVVNLARRKLGSFCRRVADEEDVAQSVFRRLCHEARNGGFPRLEDRDSLWNLLIVLTSNRAVDQKRYLGSQKRGGDQVRLESPASNASDDGQALDVHAGNDVPPEVLVQFAETHDELMNQLVPQLAQIARWKLEEYRNDEIAERLGLTPRSVRRKIGRIREIWGHELENEDL